MPKTKEQKKVVLDKLNDQLEKAKSIVFSTFSGVSIKEQEELRTKLRESDISFNVFKKTLIKKALKDKGMNPEGIEEWQGNIGTAVSEIDEVLPAKILVESSEQLEGLEVRLGYMEGALIGTEQVNALARLPGKDELIAKAVGSIRAPLAGLVGVLQGTGRNLVNVLNQIKDNK